MRRWFCRQLEDKTGYGGLQSMTEWWVLQHQLLRDLQGTPALTFLQSWTAEQRGSSGPECGGILFRQPRTIKFRLDMRYFRKHWSEESTKKRQETQNYNATIILIKDVLHRSCWVDKQLFQVGRAARPTNILRTRTAGRLPTSTSAPYPRTADTTPSGSDASNGSLSASLLRSASGTAGLSTRLLRAAPDAAASPGCRTTEPGKWMRQAVKKNAVAKS